MISDKFVASFPRSPCPVANFLDIVGDKWTLLVVRDLLLGKKTYKDFETSPERIPTNILAERLKRLERAKLIARRKYQERPVRYEYLLTDKGRDLGPVIWAMVKWSNKHIKGTVPAAQIKAIIESQAKQSP